MFRITHLEDSSDINWQNETHRSPAAHRLRAVFMLADLEAPGRLSTRDCNYQWLILTWLTMDFFSVELKSILNHAGKKNPRMRCLRLTTLGEGGVRKGGKLIKWVGLI